MVGRKEHKGKIGLVAGQTRRDLAAYTVDRVGGNVVVGNRSPAEVEKVFKAYGFNRVYHHRRDIGVAIADLQQDLRNGAPEN